MAEAIAAVGLAASIVTLVQFSAKITQRLDEFKSAKDGIPQSFRDIKAQLHLISNTVSRILAQAGEENTDEATTDVCKDVVDRTVEEAEKLIIVLDKALPKEAPSSFEREMLVLKSLSSDKKIRKCRGKLLHNVQILNLFQSANSYEEIGKVRQLLGSSSLSPPVTSNFSFGVNIGNAPQIEHGAFIGREPELEQLQGWLSPQSTNLAQKTVAISGMGGLGKTQLSLAFAKQYGHEYSSVFWLNAKDEVTLKQSFVFLSQIILNKVQNLSTSTPADEGQVIHQILQWFSQQGNGQWLLLFDNYDDPKLPGVNSPTGYDIRKYFPFKCQGSILITTRSRRLSFAQEIALQNLDDEKQGLAILSNRSRRDMEDDLDAVKLVKRLDGLPLALATAGMYLRQTNESVHDYLEAYETYWHELSDNAEELLEYEDRTLFSTWNLSLAQVRARDPDAAELLHIFAYFGSQSIWYELFRPAAHLELPWLSALVENRRRFQQAMAVLREYSLVEVSATGGYNLHSCVHDWTLQALNRELNGRYFSAAVCCIALNVRAYWEKDYWQTNQSLLDHAARIEHPHLSVFLNAENLYDGHWSYLNRLGRLWFLQEEYLRAEQFFQRALLAVERNLGPHHVSTLEIVHILGNVYFRQDRLIEAEQMFQRALNGQEKASGPDHSSTLNIIHNMAILYAVQGRFVDGERMFQRVLKGRKNPPEIDNKLELLTHYNLGIVYTGQGKSVEAEQTYQRVLTFSQKALGAEHPLTLKTVFEIGLLYQAQGRAIEAEVMFQRVSRGREKILGLGHLSTMEAICELASCYHDQGRALEAEHTLQQAIACLKNSTRLRHQDIPRAMGRLGQLYLDLNKLAEAEMMYQQALEGYKKASGSTGLGTSKVMHDFGGLYHDQGKMAEAENMYKQALAGFQKVSGLEALKVMRDLGLLYHHWGKLAEAEDMFQQALEGYKKVLGLEHKETLDTALKLANVYHKQGKMLKAEQLGSCYGILRSRESPADQAGANQYPTSRSKSMIQKSRRLWKSLLSPRADVDC